MRWLGRSKERILFNNNEVAIGWVRAKRGEFECKVCGFNGENTTWYVKDANDAMSEVEELAATWGLGTPVSWRWGYDTLGRLRRLRK